MITGPRGTGKKTLVHAACTETGAIMFDISPSNLIGKYPGKAGLNMLLHMVFKVNGSVYMLLRKISMTVFFQVAKLWPPAVVYIGECERTFMKKIPKTDKVKKIIT